MKKQRKLLFLIEVKIGMNIVGIIAEFNPFHNGHKYIIEEALRRTGADICVIAMSGNFVQRGGPSCADKWQRSLAALECGADLVVEIPVSNVLSDAGRYASSGVKLLKTMGCNAIAFGSECGDSELLRKIAQRLEDNNEELNEIQAEHRRNGMSYPAARAKSYEKLFADSDSISVELEVLSSSNDTLALEYIRAAGDMDICAVRRRGAAYLDGIEEGTVFQSASGIRALISEGGDVSAYIPEKASDVMDYAGADMIDRYFDLVRKELIMSGAEELADTPSGEQGLASRIKEAVRSADSLDDLIKKAKSRNVTYTRISRMLSQLVLGIRREDADIEPKYARILGFSRKGRELLAELRTSEEDLIPIIINVNKEAAKLDEEATALLEKDIKASDIYNILRARSLYEYSDRVAKPQIIE